MPRIVTLLCLLVISFQSFCQGERYSVVVLAVLDVVIDVGVAIVIVVNTGLWIDGTLWWQCHNSFSGLPVDTTFACVEQVWQTTVSLLPVFVNAFVSVHANYSVDEETDRQTYGWVAGGWAGRQWRHTNRQAGRH